MFSVTGRATLTWVNACADSWSRGLLTCAPGADRVSKQGRDRLKLVSGSRFSAVSRRELPPKAVATPPRNDVKMRVRHFLPGAGAICQ